MCSGDRVSGISSSRARQLAEGERTYPMDWNNVAPSIGMAWTPSAKGGFLRRVTGETGDMAIRAGYNRAYTRQSMAR